MFMATPPLMPMACPYVKDICGEGLGPTTIPQTGAILPFRQLLPYDGMWEEGNNGVFMEGIGSATPDFREE